MAADPNRIAALFAAALALSSAEQRAAYLDEACEGDAELRRRVEALLQADADAGSFLESPAAALGVTVDEPLREGPGTRIGPYKLLQQIGEGGMGVVYMAEQQEPIRRMVALKIIKPGMDSAAVVSRFEAERQALALMDHHNIARIFDGGVTDSGRPFFVMELVKGIPITRFCDENRLTPRERLELFVPVCQAVQHAHQKGVIHRDLKPSNVLVTLYDGQPVPKVIDFGVAKALHQKLTERTMFTAFGTVVGTLEYMSPEQAELNALDVDTRGDVYSLGVLLYELLTGTTPLQRKRLKQAAYDEILRLIREEEPPRPSNRLSGSGAALARISAQRKMEPAQLAKLLRGELDWIVMKALEKERGRRYETALGLARDVEHYLHDEAVEACPPSLGYRLGKFARKYRVLLSTATAFAALLLIASGVSIWLALAAKRAESVANEKREEAAGERDRAQKEWQRAEDAASQAKANAADARRALNQIILAKGIQLEEEGNLFAALPWFVRPLERGGLSPEEEKVHRTRIACYLRYTPGRPTLRQVLFPVGPVSHAAWSADGKRVLTVSDKAVQIWDVRSGECLVTIPNPAEGLIWETKPNGVIVALAAPRAVWAQFTPDGSRVLMATSKAVWTWDAHSGRQLKPPLMGWGARLQHPLCLLPRSPLQFIGNIGAQNLAVASWELSESVEISGDRRRALFAYSRFLQLLDLETRKPIKQWLRGRQWLYKDYALSSDGGRLVLIRDGLATLHDTAGGKSRVRTIDHGSPVESVAFSPDGSRVLTLGRDGTMQVWDAKTWKRLARMSGLNASSGKSAHFSPDNRLIAAGYGGHRGRLRDLSLWDVASGRRIRDMPDNDGLPERFDWKPDSQQFLRTSEHGEVVIWDITKKARPAAILPHGSKADLAVYGPNARMLLTATDDGEVRIWDLGHSRDRFALKPPLAGALDSSMQLIAAGRGGSRYWRFNATALVNPEAEPDWSASPYKQRVARFLPPRTLFNHAAVSPDQTRVLTSHVRSQRDGRAKELQLWDATAKQRLGKPLQTQSGFNCAAFRADSRLFVAGSDDGAVRLVDARTGELIGNALHQGGAVLYAAFSPDGERLVTCGSDRTARLWLTRTGQLIGELLRHGGQVTLAAFSADGRIVATASVDGSVRLWDERGGLLGIIKSKSGPARGLLFHSSGLLLIAYFNDRMRLWDVATQQEMSPIMEGLCSLMIGDESRIFDTYHGAMKNPGFDLPSDDRMVGDLIKLSHLYSGRRLDAKGGTIALSKKERQTLWRDLHAKYPEEFTVSP